MCSAERHSRPSWKWLPQPLLSGVLLITWLLVTNSIAPGHILLGALFGWAIPLFTRSFWPDPPHLVRPTMLLRLLALVIADIVTANFNVARLILGSRKALRPGFLQIPLELTDPFAITMLTSIISLTPGTVSAQLSEDRTTAWIHTLHTADPEAEVARIKQRYERRLLEIFK